MIPWDSLLFSMSSPIREINSIGASMQNLPAARRIMAFFNQKDGVKEVHISPLLYTMRCQLLASAEEQLAEDNGELPTTLHYIFCKKDGMKYTV